MILSPLLVFEGDERGDTNESLFIGVIPATRTLSMKCCLRMSRDPGLIATPFLWNEALASHSSITNVTSIQVSCNLFGIPAHDSSSFHRTLTRGRDDPEKNWG